MNTFYKFPLLTFFQILCLVCIASANTRTMPDLDVFYPARINLLKNSGFEKGQAANPTGWSQTASTSDIEFIWGHTKKYSGDRSIGIRSHGNGTGSWQQVITVEPGAYYTIKGYVAFENLGSSSKCNIQLALENKADKVVKHIDLPYHLSGSRGFAEDYPGGLVFKVPLNVSYLTIKCSLQGPGTAWFDDIYIAKTPTGSFSGTVFTDRGEPLPNAKVEVVTPMHDEYYGSVSTNSKGQYKLDNIPLALSRYILKASRSGYINQSQGNLGITPDAATNVDFKLQPGENPALLQIVFGSISTVKKRRFTQIPHGSEIPLNKQGYPKHIQPFLQSDSFITSNDPEIVKVAQDILATVPSSKRQDTRTVSRAVYDWITRNIEHSSVLKTIPEDEPLTRQNHGNNQRMRQRQRQPENQFLSVTAFKTWGTSWYDWVLRPKELLLAKRGICIERAWLTTSLLRSLNIPARAAVGQLEFWAQTKDGNGYWIGLDPTRGRESYRQNGKLGEGFESPRLYFYSVNSRPVLQMDWDSATGTIWYEMHPYAIEYDYTESGLQEALNDLNNMKSTGKAPARRRKKPRQTCYATTYKILTIDPSDIHDQEILNVRFPVVADSYDYTNTGHYAFQTNYPDSIISSSVDTINSLEKGSYEQWVNVRINLAALPKRSNPSHELAPPVQMNNQRRHFFSNGPVGRRGP